VPHHRDPGERRKHERRLHNQTLLYGSREGKSGCQHVKRGSRRQVSDNSFGFPASIWDSIWTPRREFGKINWLQVVEESGRAAGI